MRGAYAICLLAVSCGSQAKLQDDLKREQLPKAPALADAVGAPIIVVGVVQQVRTTGPTMPASDVPEALLDPIEVEIRPEIILRGELKESIKVYGFRFSSKNVRALGQKPFDPKPNERRLFFLRKESSYVRFWHDVLDYTIRVRSGSHPKFNAASFPEIGSAIAWILLTPDQGYDSEAFALHLSEYVYYAGVFGAGREASTILNRLRASSDTIIRQEAEALWQSLEADSEKKNR